MTHVATYLGKTVERVLYDACCHGYYLCLEGGERVFLTSDMVWDDIALAGLVRYETTRINYGIAPVRSEYAATLQTAPTKSLPAEAKPQVKIIRRGIAIKRWGFGGHRANRFRSLCLPKPN
ncbi:hypothetical protein [Caulobacter phage ERS]|uniref:Uncharacterized protein n=1 Tax=Caulobacter phage ERS TaxID=3020392 RepID=A0AAF0B418_9CAUD|nr:hypothetical protein [Caulobacter phage ERS]